MKITSLKIILAIGVSAGLFFIYSSLVAHATTGNAYFSGNVGIGTTTATSARLVISGGSANVLNVSGGVITGVGNPGGSTDIINKSWADGRYVPLTAFSGVAKITVGTVAPSAPSTGDLWIDTN